MHEDEDDSDRYGTPIGGFGPQIRWPTVEEQEAFWEWYSEALDQPHEIPDSSRTLVEALTELAEKTRTPLCEAYCKNRHLLDSQPAKVAAIVGDFIAHVFTGIPIPPIAIGGLLLQHQILDRLCPCNGLKA